MIISIVFKSMIIIDSVELDLESSTSGVQVRFLLPAPNQHILDFLVLQYWTGWELDFWQSSVRRSFFIIDL